LDGSLGSVFEAALTRLDLAIARAGQGDRARPAARVIGTPIFEAAGAPCRVTQGLEVARSLGARIADRSLRSPSEA
jgi:hypothetical protein